MTKTDHKLVIGDARDLTWISHESVHLVVTSPPYANLKEYNFHQDQLGNISDYEGFLYELDKVWKECLRILVPGGRICCVVGDVCISRRQAGRHYVLPLSSDIKVRARSLGFDNLQGIAWLKVANISLEASRSSRYLGKPNLPNGVIKNDVEHIVMLRKPGGYRKPTQAMEAGSLISSDDYQRWFAPIWSDIPGASMKDHPAPYPLELARRLILMFSFVGDLVVDPFVGSGTTMLAALQSGRNSIGIEIDGDYASGAEARLRKATSDFFVESTFSADSTNQSGMGVSDDLTLPVPLRAG